LAGSRWDAMDGAAAEAERLGYDVVRVEPPTLGEARDAGRAFVGRASQARLDVGRLCVLASGETTVTLAPDSTGHGGRSQEFALAAALAAGAPAFRSVPGWTLLSAGLDGIDGPTDAAGAIADATTIVRAREHGLDAAAALLAHDSYPFFRQLGDLVMTGPTGTNVCDLQVLLIG